MNIWKYIRQQICREKVRSLPLLGGPRRNRLERYGKWPRLRRSEIIFDGKGNTLIVEDGVKLKDSRILFAGNGSVVYLSRSKSPYRINVTINNGSLLFFGEGNSFTGTMTIILSEEKNVIIGSHGLYSYDICIRTADPHLIYDTESHRRMNLSRSVVIGDHVWLGQQAMILKGSVIGSGAVLGAKAVLGGRSVPSNECWAGSPARSIRKNIFWSSECVHTWTSAETEAFQTKEEDTWIYGSNAEESLLQSISDEKDPLALARRLASAKEKDRFFV